MRGFFTSMADYDINAPVAQAAANKKELGNIFQGQRGETSDFLNRYTGAIQGQEKTSALAQRIGGELGLPTLQANARSMQNTLFNLPSTYSKATTGYDVNANQLARVVGTKQAELAPAAELAQQNAQDAQNTLNTRMGYEQMDQQKALIPYQSEQGLLSDRMARESSGYTTMMQGELDAIVQKMNAGITLSEGEKNRAQQLAIAEAGFKNALKIAEMNQQKQDPFVAMGEGTTLFNTQTGQKVYTAPKTATPQAGGSGGGIGSYYSYGGSSTPSAPSYFKPR